MNLGKRLLLVACLVGSPGLAHAEGDATKGKTLFSRCAACHAAGNQNKVGPGLAGIVGRPAASAPGFRYSKAMTGSGLTWTEEQLDTYLGGPAKAVPGTTMAVAVPNAQDRSDIIAFLKTLPAQ
jgi:cytochrome c